MSHPTPARTVAHTPGPWKCQKAPRQQHAIDRKWEIVAPMTDGGEQIIVGEHTGIDCLTEANARLIATAPELLAALKAVIQYHAEGAWHMEETYLDTLRQAIADATLSTDEMEEGREMEKWEARLPGGIPGKERANDHRLLRHSPGSVSMGMMDKQTRVFELLRKNRGDLEPLNRGGRSMSSTTYVATIRTQEGQEVLVLPRSKKHNTFKTTQAALQRLEQVGKRLYGQGQVKDLDGNLITTIAL